MNFIDSHACFYSAWGEWVGTGIGELCVDYGVEIEKPVKGGDTFDWLFGFAMSLWGARNILYYLFPDELKVNIQVIADGLQGRLDGFV